MRLLITFYMIIDRKRTHLSTLKNWLDSTSQNTQDRKYYYRKLEENISFRLSVLNELKILVHQVHENTRQELRKLTGISNSLDPLGEIETPGINTSFIDDFPCQLELKTLKGYFGEIMAAIIAENYNSLDENWEVPVFPFRLHQTAYHALEKIQQGDPPPTIIGRHGNDMLAFKRNSDGRISHILFCEAKCTETNNSGLISDAHKQSSNNNIIPVDCLLLIRILQDNNLDNSEANVWIQALQSLYWSRNNPIHERCDLVSYVCGLPPVRPETVVIPKDVAHSDYTGKRRLEAVEVHLYDVNGLIEKVYNVKIKENSYKQDKKVLSDVWDQITPYIPTNNRSLVLEYCHLKYFDGSKAIISVDDLSRFRDVKRIIKKIRKAFKDSGNFVPSETQLKIKLKLVS